MLLHEHKTFIFRTGGVYGPSTNEYGRSNLVYFMIMLFPKIFGKWIDENAIDGDIQ
jgi:hypothetical protein